MDVQRRVLTVALLGWTLSARAQPAKLSRVGVLIYSTPEGDPNLAAFRAALGELGYAEGRNLRLELRFAGGKPERLAELAQELVQAKPDVIFALGGDVLPFVQKATRTIPVVMWVSNDPIEMRFVQTLARPGENITGVTLVLDQVAGKRLALLKELMPRLSRAAVLWNPEHADPEFREMRRAAATLGVELQSLEVRRAEDFDAALEAARKARTEALIPVSSRLINLQRRKILQFADQERMPVIGDWGEWQNALLSYGPNTAQMAARAASYVDLVLKGARPADLPVQQPTKFDLVVNLKTARALGIAVPPAVLLRADRVVVE
jgi:putative ABC transport system substrate-binding protein